MCKVTEAVEKLSEEERESLRELSRGHEDIGYSPAIRLLDLGLADLTLGELHLTFQGRQVAQHVAM